jgi:hypothetical protein
MERLLFLPLLLLLLVLMVLMTRMTDRVGWCLVIMLRSSKGYGPETATLPAGE